MSIRSTSTPLTPRWIWLLSGGVVLAMGILVYGWAKSLDRRVQAPVPVPPAAPATATPESPAPVDAPTADSSGIKLASIDEKKPAFFRPEPIRRDFELVVELIGAKTEPDKLPQLTEDSDLTLGVTPAEDAYLSLWTLSPDGSATQLYPLAGKEPVLAKGGEKQTLPEGLVYKANFLGDAPERIWIFASSHAWSLPSKAQANNLLVEFTNPAASDAFEKEIRGEIHKSLKKESSARVSEHIFQYVVLKK